MSFLRKLKARLFRHTREAELEEELRFHLEEEAVERGTHGARRSLGNLTSIKEETRAAWGTMAARLNPLTALRDE